MNKEHAFVQEFFLARAHKRSSTSLVLVCMPEAFWFSEWCKEGGLPNPFIGWGSDVNPGIQSELGPDNEYTRLAKEWCRALEEKQPEIARLGNGLLEGMDAVDVLFPGKDLLHPDLYLSTFSGNAWNRLNVAKWYAILKNGIEHGDTLAYC